MAVGPWERTLSVTVLAPKPTLPSYLLCESRNDQVGVAMCLVKLWLVYLFSLPPYLIVH